MARTIRVASLGLGPIGVAIAQLLSRRAGVDLVGAIDVDPSKVGRDLGSVLGLDPLGVDVGETMDALSELHPDVVVCATSSSLQLVSEQIEVILESGANVISTCEELAYPVPAASRIKDRLDRLARARSLRVLGTGVNPGFLMDALPSMLTLACTDVESVSVVRVVDTARRRRQLRAKTGAGITVEDFEERARRGTIGHIGLAQSAYLIGAALGWSLDDYAETIEPIMVDVEKAVNGEKFPAGVVAGVHQRGTGRVEDEPRILLDIVMAVDAKHPRDEIKIVGSPPVEVTVRGGVDGDQATAAIAVNCIPGFMAAPPGFVTMLDVPIGRRSSGHDHRRVSQEPRG